MSDWRTATVAQLEAEGSILVQDGNHGNDRPLASEFVEVGTPFIRAADISLGVVAFDHASRINSDAVSRIRKGHGRAGDSLLTHKGTVGKVAYVPLGSEPFVCSPQTTFWRSTDPDVLDRRFLTYILQSPRFVAQLDSQKGETDMAPYVSLTQQRSLRVDLPSIYEQQAIAEVLGALDDKIAANTALAGVADELMHHSLLSASSGPRVPLSLTANFVNGRAFTKGASGTGRVVVRIAELNAGISKSTVLSDALVDDKHVARPGDILFAWSGSLTLHRWFRDEAIVNQHIFKVIPGAGYPSWLIYELLRRKLSDFKAIAADKATTMGHIQGHHLDELVELPSPEAVDQLNPLMSGLWHTVLNAQQESMTLTATRDALLPQLMSGKLRVRDAEAAASAAGA